MTDQRQIKATLESRKILLTPLNSHFKKKEANKK